MLFSSKFPTLFDNPDKKIETFIHEIWLKRMGIPIRIIKG